jgi:hypothetical protein
MIPQENRPCRVEVFSGIGSVLAPDTGRTALTISGIAFLPIE